MLVKLLHFTVMLWQRQICKLSHHCKILVTSSTVTVIEIMSNYYDICEINSTHFHKPNPSKCTGMCYFTKISSKCTMVWLEGRSARMWASAFRGWLSARPLSLSWSAYKEKSSRNTAVLCLHSRSRILGFPVWKPLTQPRQNASRETGCRNEKQGAREGTVKVVQGALLACSKPVCMRRKSRSLHSQALSCLSRSEPSRSPGPSLPTWVWSSDTRCSASCTSVAKCTARPSRLTTRKHIVRGKIIIACILL